MQSWITRDPRLAEDDATGSQVHRSSTSTNTTMGTDFYTMGALSVDRPKREFRVWVCRIYEDYALPETLSFFRGFCTTCLSRLGRRGSVFRGRIRVILLLQVPSVSQLIPWDLPTLLSFLLPFTG
jgi:hypothetical protein